MGQKLEELIARQETTFGEIKQLCTNYKKDSADRKTIEYLNKRLSALNSIWEQFTQNHRVLETTGTYDIQYFTEGVFGKTKFIYEEVLSDITKRRSSLLSTTEKTPTTPTTPAKIVGGGPAVPRFDFAEVSFQVPPPQSGDINEKQQDLLRQQFCNFKAFERTVGKIDIEGITEKWDLEDTLQNLKNKWEHIEKVNWELDYILNDDETNYKEKYLSSETIYDNLRKQLNHKIWNSAHFEKATPRIIIPDFHGNYNQWNTFRDLYIASVHNNPQLSKAQKMQHLKSKLKGEAEKLVQHLGISAENYTSCWEIITHRYDNKRLLFTSYMNTLLSQPQLHQGSAAGIKKLHDVMLECLNGLKNIGLDVSTWDPIIVYLLGQKLDSETYNEYMKDLKEPRELPDLEPFTKFLENKFMALEAVQGGNNQKALQTFKHPHPQNKQQKPNNMQAPRNNNYFHKNYNASRASNFGNAQTSPNTFATTTRKCPICKTDHVLMQCDKFLLMNASDRHDTVRKLQLCKNCLYSHGEKQCYSGKRCKLCYKNHHTLMHETGTSPQVNNQASTSTAARAVNNVTNNDKEVLLTTVLLKVKTIDENFIILRGLLDQGSQVSLITEDAAQRLRLPRKKGSAIVSGVGALSGSCKGSLQLECKSLHSDYQFRIETLIIKKLINNLPTTSFSKDNWHYLENLKLADPQFNISGPVDLLLGADLYSTLILDGVLKDENNEYPVAQQTRVGWVLCGNVKTFKCLAILNDLENISRFWETEDITENLNHPSEEDTCEKYFTETTTRLPDGKYVVQMPMKTDYQHRLGDTRRQALAQFLQLERRMKKNTNFANDYKNFIKEYIAMGHMKPAPKGVINQVFLPHHGVERVDSTTTKLRVVFNASNKGSTGYSLNELMRTGPNLQKDMLTLMINWRVHKYVFTADIEKMYRQIWLNENQQQLQTIIWRDAANQPLQEWQLCTVTYGTKSAPYLAMRTLHQLARDGSDSKVVLAWLQGNVNRWEIFVANRVKQINNIIKPTQWSYVKSEENLADCATRGLSPSNLLTFNLWWKGPHWLQGNNSELNKDDLLTYTTNDGTKTNCCANIKDNSCETTNLLLSKFSSLKRVIRVLAWILRAGSVYRKQSNTTNMKNNLTKRDNKGRVMALTAKELTEATELLIKTVQNQYYADDMEHLKKTGSVSTKSSLIKLTPYVDETGLLRVRGRLSNSILPAATKHPIILPVTGRLTELIIQESHRETLHGGARLTLGHLRQQYWIVGGRRTVNNQLRQCVRCHRFKPHRNEQLMANLPKERVTPTRPFTNTGVDYTGHVEVKINKGRGVKTCKAYIAIFICMVTKATHLELVSDLSTQTFLAAFKRMCARRGRPNHVYSDNGTNFIGAANELQRDFEQHKTFSTSEFHNEINHQQIHWHFNAPLWPTAGGLWEAAVKSMKYHLKRVLGEQKLTYEQFTTLLSQFHCAL